MSVRLSNIVWGTKCSSPQEKLVLLALADHMNEHTKACFPSITILANRTQLSRRQVIRYLNSLEESGKIVREKGHSGKSTRYHFGGEIVSPMTLPSVAHDTLTRSNQNGLKKSKVDTICNGALEVKPTWKPTPKDEQLKPITPPANAPSQEEFDSLLAEKLPQVENYRPDLYRELCLNKWHHWNKSINRWTPIRDWQAYVTALDGKIEQAITGP